MALRKLRSKAERHGSRLLTLLPPIMRQYVRPLTEDPYQCWRHVNIANARRSHLLAQAAKASSAAPRFSILVPVYNCPVEILSATISSVESQSFDRWELILVDDASTDSLIRPLLENWSDRDPRIRVFFRADNGNISVATNAAALQARGDYLVLLDHDDMLDPSALAHLAAYLAEHSDVDLVYTDDDKIDSENHHHSPQFKPGWSPELLLSFCYTGHLTAIRRSLYHDVGGMRAGFEGSQDHDFWLRASERTRRIGHLPQLLYHWRVLPGSTAASGHAKPHSFEAGRRAVEEAFNRRGIACPVIQPDWALQAGCAIFQPVMPDEGPSVAILIPSKNHEPYLRRLLSSLEKTTYRNYRIYIVDNESDEPATRKFLASLPHRVLTISSPGGVFNFAAINNRAAEQVDEDLLVFLNDDTEVINPRWLSQMVGWSRLAGVAAVGARLLFPDHRIQHAGIVHGLHDGHAEHAFRGQPAGDPGYLNLARVTRNSLAVTAACMLTPRELFLKSGMFDERRFGVAYNDVDYCYRLVDAGFRCVYCAEAELYHHETASRGTSDNPHEVANYRAIHGPRMDPYFSGHLNPHSVCFEIHPTVIPVATQPRRIPTLAVSHNLNWEGAPRFEFELMSRLARAGWIRPLVVSPSDGPLKREFESVGIRVEIDPELATCVTDRLHYNAAISKFTERIRRDNFELVHANTLQTFWAIDAARRAQVPSVWSLHESERWHGYYDHLPREIAHLALSCFAQPYRIVFTARSTLHAWRELESRSNFDLIRFALNTERFQAELATSDRTRARAELGLAGHDLCFLLLGTVCERKGQHDLLKAFSELPSEIAGRMTCLIVGAREAESYSRELRRQAAKLPPDRRKRFQIHPETGATAKFWLAADVFCCTSRIESYPHVILEAMGSGLPIISTPVFGISEQVRPGINALVYEPGDIQTLAWHLECLVKQPLLLRSLAEYSSVVLSGLPTWREMDEKYRLLFLAAAESSVFPDPYPAHDRTTRWRMLGRSLVVNRQQGGATSRFHLPRLNRLNQLEAATANEGEPHD